MNISKEEFIEKYCKIVNGDIKYPIYKCENFDSETNMYIGLEIIKTVDELIKEQLELENQEPSKTKICTMEDLQEENKKLWDTVEYLLKQTEAGIPKEEEEVI